VALWLETVEGPLRGQVRLPLLSLPKQELLWKLQLRFTLEIHKQSCFGNYS
jgi:hypothetical protein